MSIMVAVGRGAHAGVLHPQCGGARNARQGGYAGRRQDRGTLTEGKPLVTGIKVFAGSDFAEDSLLSIAASLERLSEHPLARAVVSAAQEKRLPLSTASEFRANFRAGVEGLVAEKRVIVGTASFLREQGIEVPAEQRAAEARGFLGGDARVRGGGWPCGRRDSVGGPNQAVHAASDSCAAGGRDAYCSPYRRSPRPWRIEWRANSVSRRSKRKCNRSRSRNREALRSQGRVVAMAGDGTSASTSWITEFARHSIRHGAAISGKENNTHPVRPPAHESLAAVDA